MATRAQHAATAANKAARSAALQTLTGERLPLPTDRRTTPAAFSDELPAEIVALGSEGLTETQIADHLCLSADDLQVMGNTHSAAKDAISRARTAAKAWWEEQARRALVTENNRFPAGAWAQVMKARFPDYDDKPSVLIDLGQLVVIKIDQPGLLQEQTVGPAKSLIEGEAVRQAPSLTGEGSTETNLSLTLEADDQQDGEPGGAAGG